MYREEFTRRSNWKLRNQKPKFYQQHKLMIILVTLGIVAMAVSGFIVFKESIFDMFEIAAPNYDKNLCLESGIRGRTIILIDRTDPLTPSQQDATRKYIDQKVDEMISGEELRIYYLNDEEYYKLPHFVRCNPGQKTNLSDLYKNREKVKRRFEVEFIKAINASLEILKSNDSGSASPIMQTIAMIMQDITVGKNKGTNKLIIISDFMENDPDIYSHYSKNAKAPTMADYNKSKIRNVTSVNLSGIRVSMVYLRKSDVNNSQNTNEWVNGHIKFWKDWFKAKNADTVEEPLIIQ